MANEAIIRNKLSDFAVDFTCADGTGIEKGALLALTDARTAVASTTAGEPIAGIAAREKIANDGRTTISVITGPVIVDVYASGAIDIGAPLMSAGVQNEVKVASANISGARCIGYALEAASDTEVFQAYFRVGGGF